MRPHFARLPLHSKLTEAPVILKLREVYEPKRTAVCDFRMLVPTTRLSRAYVKGHFALSRQNVGVPSGQTHGPKFWTPRRRRGSKAPPSLGVACLGVSGTPDLHFCGVLQWFGLSEFGFFRVSKTLLSRDGILRKPEFQTLQAGLLPDYGGLTN